MQFLSQEYFSIRHSFQVVYLFLATRLIYGSFLSKYATRQSMIRRCWSCVIMNIHLASD